LLIYDVQFMLIDCETFVISVHYILFLNVVRLIVARNSVQVLNMLACWIEDPNSEAFKLHIPRVYDYLWLAEDGMKMQVIIACSVAHFLLLS
jgi:hypothetical protein